MNKNVRAMLVVLCLCTVLASLTHVVGQNGAVAKKSVTTVTFNTEVQDFLEQELAAHLGAINSLSPPPAR